MDVTDMDLQREHIYIMWGHAQYDQVRLFLYSIYILKHGGQALKAWRATSGWRTPRRAAGGRTPQAGGGQAGAILRMGMLCMSVAFIQVRAPGYFTNISITTPIVSALKNYYR
jgi:hypothetical protein